MRSPSARLIAIVQHGVSASSLGSTMIRVGPWGCPGLRRSYSRVIRQISPSNPATPAPDPMASFTTLFVVTGSNMSCQSLESSFRHHPIAPEQHTTMFIRSATTRRYSTPGGVLAVATTTGIPAAASRSSARIVEVDTEKSRRIRVPSRSATTARTRTPPFCPLPRWPDRTARRHL